jgi:hypothetical protein
MKNPIHLSIQKSGTPAWWIDLRCYNLGRPQFHTEAEAKAALERAHEVYGRRANQRNRSTR